MRQPVQRAPEDRVVDRPIVRVQQGLRPLAVTPQDSCTTTGQVKVGLHKQVASLEPECVGLRTNSEAKENF
ncbi:MAG: hypothetical protein AAGD43_33295 [Pseudomonadota bacterium]